MEEFRLNKKAFAIYPLSKEPKGYEYWLTQSFEKRLAAIEFLRQQYHSEHELKSRLQRVYRITPSL